MSTDEQNGGEEFKKDRAPDLPQDANGYLTPLQENENTEAETVEAEEAQTQRSSKVECNIRIDAAVSASPQTLVPPAQQIQTTQREDMDETTETQEEIAPPAEPQNETTSSGTVDAEEVEEQPATTEPTPNQYITCPELKDLMGSLVSQIERLVNAITHESQSATHKRLLEQQN